MDGSFPIFTRTQSGNGTGCNAAETSPSASPRALGGNPFNDEVWRTIPGLDGRFEASSYGRIRRSMTPYLGATRPPGSLVRHANDKNGYFKFHSSIRGVCVSKKWHQLIALAFLGERPCGKQVAHIDGNRSNNRADNLAYVTPAENASHKYAHGTIVTGERVHSSKLTENDVREIRASSEAPSVIGKRFGINPRHVWRLRKRLQWAHIGGAEQ